jgi:bifunctional UDP-N-acetylglucosamine pyrophosphorylase/glucosamine-1-phosphate N-acetyltransferase
MTGRTSLTIVLAAGEGTRMRSSVPKVLHPVAGQSLLAHVLEAAPKGTGASLAVVTGPDHSAVAEEAKRVRPDATTFIQRERLGTAHAVLAARDAFARGADDLLVAFGDTPLISAATFARLRAPPTRPDTAGCWSRRINWSRSASRPTPAPQNARSISATPA